MNEQQVREIIADELARFMGINGYFFDRNIKIFDARNIYLGKTNGTKIGTETTQKLGFFGATPVNQQSVASLSSGGTDSDGTARSGVNAIITHLHNLGLFQ